ncbi:TPA: hypothetical protein HA361_04685 [Candidatus Woesearchaeota archaeon]|nr:hypothetical protein [Candidatus Woesearchaeota archaeon]HII68263.1 hypothetical protein [Candidatus Woesearchaeota archaeon]
MESYNLPEREWISLIETIARDDEIAKKGDINDGYQKSDPPPANAAGGFARAIEGNTIRLAKPPVGLLFSGGIDSTLLALLLKKNAIPFTCFSISMERGKDKASSAAIASALGLKHIQSIITIGELEESIKEVIKILGEPDVLKVSVGCVEYFGMKKAKQHGCRTAFSGLGSEELFAGYKRHEEALERGYSAVKEECETGLKAMWQRDIQRIMALAEAVGIVAALPFLTQEVITAALRIPPEQKITREQDKLPVREYAQKLGLRKALAQKKKAAAQYGSWIIRGMDKLAKKNGYATKRELVASYSIGALK